MNIQGLDAILQNIMRLNVDEALENKALTKAGKITQETVKSVSPEDKGVLKKNIKLRRPKDGEVVIHTGKAFHAHLIEFGRSAGSITLRNGRRVTWGRTTPNPFFSQAFEQSKNQAKQAMIDELQRGLGI